MKRVCYVIGKYLLPHFLFFANLPFQIQSLYQEKDLQLSLFAFLFSLGPQTFLYEKNAFSLLEMTSVI